MGGTGGKFKGTGVAAGVIGRGELWGRDGNRVHHGTSQHSSRKWCYLEKCETGREAGRTANDQDDFQSLTKTVP